MLKALLVVEEAALVRTTVVDTVVGTEAGAEEELGATEALADGVH